MKLLQTNTTKYTFLLWPPRRSKQFLSYLRSIIVILYVTGNIFTGSQT